MKSDSNQKNSVPKFAQVKFNRTRNYAREIMARFALKLRQNQIKANNENGKKKERSRTKLHVKVTNPKRTRGGFGPPFPHKITAYTTINLFSCGPLSIRTRRANPRKKRKNKNEKR
jgi:hypothetical protein